MIYDWKPEPIDGEDGEKIEPKLAGTVQVEIPKYVQRLKYLREAKFKVNSEGQVDNSVNNLDLMIKAVELAEKHIKTVDLTVKDTGEKITSAELMGESAYCDEALVEIGFMVLNGPPLGKR